MKRLLPLLNLMFICVLIHGQSLTPEVIATAGNMDQGSTCSLSWTIGEIATGTLNGSGCSLAHGFQAYLPGIITGIENLKPDIAVEIFPVPASSFITVNVGTSVKSILNMELIDLNGKNLIFKKLDQGSNYVNLSSLKSAEYIIHISDTDGNLIRSVKFVKY